MGHVYFMISSTRTRFCLCSSRGHLNLSAVERHIISIKCRTFTLKDSAMCLDHSLLCLAATQLSLIDICTKAAWMIIWILYKETRFVPLCDYQNTTFPVHPFASCCWPLIMCLQVGRFDFRVLTPHTLTDLSSSIDSCRLSPTVISGRKIW